MNTSTKRFVQSAVALAALAIGCSGGNDHESGGGARVTKLEADNQILNVGGSAIVRLGLSYSSHAVFDDGENVIVDVRLPRSLALRAGTVDIKRPIDDRSVEPRSFTCGDGTTLFELDLDGNDLADADNPSGDADAEIRFTVDATSAAEDGIIAAVAQDGSPAGSCSSFPQQATAPIVVR